MAIVLTINLFIASENVYFRIIISERYLPIQKEENILVSKSSEVNSPVISLR
jgi:hypothetical protein